MSRGKHYEDFYNVIFALENFLVLHLDSAVLARRLGRNWRAANGAVAARVELVVSSLAGVFLDWLTPRVFSVDFFAIRNYQRRFRAHCATIPALAVVHGKLAAHCAAFVCVRGGVILIFSPSCQFALLRFAAHCT